MDQEIIHYPRATCSWCEGEWPYDGSCGACVCMSGPKPSYVPDGAPWCWSADGKGDKVAMWVTPTGVLIHDPDAPHLPWGWGEYMKGKHWENYPGERLSSGLWDDAQGLWERVFNAPESIESVNGIQYPRATCNWCKGRVQTKKCSFCMSDSRLPCIPTNTPYCWSVDELGDPVILSAEKHGIWVVGPNMTWSWKKEYDDRNTWARQSYCTPRLWDDCKGLWDRINP